MVDCGFVSRLIETENFRQKVLEIANEAAQFSVEAVKTTKRLIRGVDIELLEQVNVEEIKALKGRMESPDSLESIMKFIGK
jgi:peroxisomal 3,2-trans-enoyl-CoA isomerase